VAESRNRGYLLICEPYPGLREALQLTLGGGYGLVFTGTPAEIPALLDRHPIRLVVWDLDQHDPDAFPKLLNDLDRPPEWHVSTQDCLAILRGIHDRYPKIPVLFLAHQFDDDFLATMFHAHPDVNIFQKPWSVEGLAEHIEITLRDRDAPATRVIIRLPIVDPPPPPPPDQEVS